MSEGGLTVYSADETRDTSQTLGEISKRISGSLFGGPDLSDPDYASFLAQYIDHPERFADEAGEENVSKSYQVQPGAFLPICAAIRMLETALIHTARREALRGCKARRNRDWR